MSSLPDFSALRTRDLEPIVRKYVNPSVARTIPELQRSIVKLIGHDDPRMRRTIRQVQRMYCLPREVELPNGQRINLLNALIIAYTLDREAERRHDDEARIKRSALAALIWGRA